MEFFKIPLHFVILALLHGEGDAGINDGPEASTVLTRRTVTLGALSALLGGLAIACSPKVGVMGGLKTLWKS